MTRFHCKLYLRGNPGDQPPLSRQYHGEGAVEEVPRPDYIVIGPDCNVQGRSINDNLLLVRDLIIQSGERRSSQSRPGEGILLVNRVYGESARENYHSWPPPVLDKNRFD